MTCYTGAFLCGFISKRVIGRIRLVVLLLPDYRDRAVLRERLLVAIENAEGFGLA